MILLGVMCTCWQMLVVYLMEYCVEIRHLEVIDWALFMYCSFCNHVIIYLMLDKSLS
jgi:hypothetical protein